MRPPAARWRCNRVLAVKYGKNTTRTTPPPSPGVWFRPLSTRQLRSAEPTEHTTSMAYRCLLIFYWSWKPLTLCWVTSTQCRGGRTELLSHILRFAIASRGKNSYRLTQSIRTLITLCTAYHIVRTLSIWTSEFYNGLHDTQAYRLSQRFPTRGDFMVWRVI